MGKFSAIKFHFYFILLIALFSLSFNISIETQDYNSDVQNDYKNSLRNLDENMNTFRDNENDNVISNLSYQNSDNSINTYKRRNLSINDNLSLCTQCANSGDNCSIGPGFFRVKFGSNNNWKSKSFSSKSQMNIPCSPEIFGFNFNWKKEKYSMVELSFGPNNIIIGITSDFEMMVKYPDKS